MTTAAPTGIDDSYTAGSQWEDSFGVDPRLARDRRYRLVVLGNKVALDGNGNGTFAYQPQVRFLPRRLIIPSGTTGFVANLQVGVDPIHVSSTPEPFEMFSEKADSGLFDGVVCEPNIKISGQITGGTASTTIYAAIIGFALDRPASPLVSRLMRQGITSTTVATTVTSTITVNPQKRFRPRRLVFDSTGANAASVIVTDIRIQNVPQLMSSDPVPLLAFSELSSEGLAYIDMDECAPAAAISITVTNNAGSNAVIQGVIEGDTV